MMLYLYAGVALLVALLGAAVTVQTSRLDTCKTEHAAFVVQVKAVGDAQNAATKLKDAENKTKMEKANSENLKTKSALTAALNGLRNNHPSSSFVPSAPAGASRPELTCYDRPQFVGATGKLIEGIRGLADEGSAATVDLNTAKSWAQKP